jgi:AAA ATPase domain
MSDTDALASTVEHARWFAALSGPFDPADALRASMQEGPALDSQAAVAVASRLCRVCDTRPDAGGLHWLMRGTERRWDIDRLRDNGELENALAWRSRNMPFDELARDVVAALRGSEAFGPAALDDALKQSETRTIFPHEQLEHLAIVLEWVGPAAPGYSHLERIRAAIARAEDRRRSDMLLSHELHGRDEQLQTLRDWLAAPVSTPPIHALFVTGLPGIGKSSLLERAIRETIAEQRTTIVVRLDFDRTTLDVLDQVGLTLEAARQIAMQLPEQAASIRELRLRASGGGTEALKGRGRESIPSELASMLGTALRSAAATTAVVLDTCEILRGRGETHPRRLFEWLDSLIALGVAPMVVVAAGRGDAFDSIPDRIGARFALAELAPGAANLLLDAAGVPVSARDNIHAFAKGNPLLLRLSSAPFAMAPGARLSSAGSRSRSRNKELSEAHLYRFLLSRIPDPDLQRLVNPGLLVRRISVELIRDVLAPQLGLRRIGDVRAKRLFEELKALSWLIEPDMFEGWLRQNPRMRVELVPLLYANKPALCAKIDRAAADWFARLKEPFGSVEALYHRLQLTRRGEAAPKVGRDVALQFNDSMLSELPPRAKDAVLQARGQRSTAARASVMSSSSHQLDARAVRDMQSCIERGDWLEAATLYAHAFETNPIDPASEAGDAVRTLLWRIGRWQAAKMALQAFDKANGDDDNVDKMRADDAIARIEMRAEFAYPKFANSLADESWRQKIQSVANRGTKSDMTAGALGFALCFADVDIKASWRSVDPVGAAFELWSSGPAATVLASALAHADHRISSRVSGTPSWLQNTSGLTASEAFRTPDVVRRLAVHSPYARPLGLAAQLEKSRRLTTHARNTLAALAKIDLARNAGITGLQIAPSSPPQEPIEILADLGLVNEWIGAAAFAGGGRDIKPIARSAEAWRRTLAGLWSYGRAPGSWQGVGDASGLDLLLLARTRELLATKDPPAASRSVIAAWSGVDGALPDRLRTRLAALVRRARRATARSKGENRALQAALVLVRAGAPAAFIPALATLAVSGRQKSGRRTVSHRRR